MSPSFYHLYVIPYMITIKVEAIYQLLIRFHPVRKFIYRKWNDISFNEQKLYLLKYFYSRIYVSSFIFFFKHANYITNQHNFLSNGSFNFPFHHLTLTQPIIFAFKRGKNFYFHLHWVYFPLEKNQSERVEQQQQQKNWNFPRQRQCVMFLSCIYVMNTHIKKT